MERLFAGVIQFLVRACVRIVSFFNLLYEYVWTTKCMCLFFAFLPSSAGVTERGMPVQVSEPDSPPTGVRHFFHFR